MPQASLAPRASIAPDEVKRASELARSHPHRSALSALAFDVLSRQGQARMAFTGREFLETRAAEHGVERAMADTEGGNLLTLLERGPQTEGERALIAAFAAEGLRTKLDGADAEGRSAVVARFTAHADWLLGSSPFVLYPFVEASLTEGQRADLWAALADAVLGDDQPTPQARSRNASRLTVLSEATDEAAADALRRVAAEASDGAVVSLARALTGESPPEPDAAEGPLRLHGRVGRAPATSARDALRIASGVAALQWLARAVGGLVGLTREAEVALVPGGVRVHRRTRLLGRTLRESDETYAMAAVAGAGRTVRYPALHLLVGLIALAVGVGLGGLWLFEGLATGETFLLLAAAGAILVGGGLDLALHVLVPGRRGQVAVDLRVLSGKNVRLVRVAREEADRFLDALSRRFA
ncbi:MAG: hypothetical protein ACOC9O_02300 [Myxococcota bacterium]